MISFFGSNKSSNDSSSYDQIISDLKRQVRELSKKVDSYEEQMKSSYANANWAIDFSIMNVFSIERLIENGVDRTVIGYFVEETEVAIKDGIPHNTKRNVVHQWYLYCPYSQHEKLVAEFEKFKALKG
jgi:hypothetical protein